MTQEIAALGFPTSVPPSVEASRIDALRTLWQGAGLVDVETCAISIERTFDDFDAFWRIARTGPRFAPVLATMGPQDLLRLQERLRARLPAADDGRITYGARANAVRGRVPAEARITAARREVGSARHRDGVVARVAVDELAERVDPARAAPAWRRA
jgi:hypothetical protein